MTDAEKLIAEQDGVSFEDMDVSVDELKRLKAENIELQDLTKQVNENNRALNQKNAELLAHNRKLFLAITTTRVLLAISDNNFTHKEKHGVVKAIDELIAMTIHDTAIATATLTVLDVSYISSGKVPFDPYAGPPPSDVGDIPF